MYKKKGINYKRTSGEKNNENRKININLTNYYKYYKSCRNYKSE